MPEIIECVGKFITSVGGPLAIAAFACTMLALTWQFLRNQWDRKDKRIDRLERRVDDLANGQRQAVEKRLDETKLVIAQANKIQGETNTILDRVATAMDSWARVIQHCKDMTDDTADDEAHAMERIERRQRRKEKREAGQ